MKLELAEVRAAVAGARSLPTEAAVPRLETALRRLTAAQAALDSPEAIPELEELRRELAGLKNVLDYAAAWHAAWARVLHGIAGGYTAEGVAPLPLEPRFTVHG